MGNHTAGNMIAAFAETLSKQRVSEQTLRSHGARPDLDALRILDEAVSRARNTPGFTPDAEFEASHPTKPGIVHPEISSWTDPHPLAPLGMLMVEAFAPDGLRDLSRYWYANGVPMEYPSSSDIEAAACDLWWEEVYKPFKTRYGLC